MTAAQQTNPGIVRMLVNRGANINLQNANGNTALHYAMAYDASGDLGEYLIGQGADDALENQWGLSPYDGITADDG
jgi:ankyrin repeat protein